MKTCIRFCCFFIWLVLLLTSCTRQEKNDLVTVAGHGLNQDFFMRRFQSTQEYARASEITESQVKNYIKDNFVAELLILAEAYAIQLHQDSSFVGQMLEEKKKLLTRNNGPLYQKIVPSKFPATSQELRNFYDSTGIQIQTAHILVKSGQLADSLYQLLQTGADFSKLARSHSLDLRTAENGGVNRRFMNRFEMTPAYDRAAFALEKQQFSPPIETAIGYYIIKVLDRKLKVQKPFEQITTSVQEKFKAYKQARFFEGYILNLFQKYQLSISNDLIDMINLAYRDMKRYGKIELGLIPESHRWQKFVIYQGGAWTVTDFVRKYNEFPNNNQFPLRDPDELQFFVKTAVLPDLMYQDALVLKLDHDRKFQKELRAAEENRLKIMGWQRLLYDKIQPDEADISSYYQAHQTEFGLQPFNVVKPLVTSQLRKEMTQKLQQSLLDELGKKFPVIYNERRLKSVTEKLDKAKEKPKDKIS